MPVFDGHNDVLLPLHRKGDAASSGFFERGLTGHLDLPRARRQLCGWPVRRLRAVDGR
jgi:hypothetical protein